MVQGLSSSNEEGARIRLEIRKVLFLCRTDFNGYKELDHSCYSGGLDDQPWDVVEHWKMVIECFNSAISETRNK